MGQSLEATVIAGILAQSSVTALIGTRLYQNTLPQTVLGTGVDAATLVRVSSQSLQTLDRANREMGWARLQVDCWSQDAARAKAIAAAISDAFLTFSASAPGVPVAQCGAPNFTLTSRNEVEPNPQQPIFRACFDVKVWFIDQS